MLHSIFQKKKPYPNAQIAFARLIQKDCRAWKLLLERAGLAHHLKRVSTKQKEKEEEEKRRRRRRRRRKTNKTKNVIESKRF